LNIFLSKQIKTNTTHNELYSKSEGLHCVHMRGDWSHFSDPDCAPVPKFWNPGPAIFQIWNPTPVQTPATIINPTLSYPCFYLRNDHTDSVTAHSDDPSFTFA